MGELIFRIVAWVLQVFCIGVSAYHAHAGAWLPAIWWMMLSCVFSMGGAGDSK